MDISKFEQQHDLKPGEITKTIAEVFPKFTKHELSLVRHPEHGVVLSPKACKHLKAKYKTPTSITVNFTADEMQKILQDAENLNIDSGDYIHQLICNGKE